jgi:putative endonuclease
MSCCVYILFSKRKAKYYVGVANDISDRLARHNAGQSISTKFGIPWQLVQTIECIDKSEAMKLESKIKKRGIKRYLTEHGLI